jgi:ATP-dependent RNA helicase DDX55/SPB4
MAKPLTIHQVGAIVIAPTRELAKQIHTVFTSLLPSNLTCNLFIGGTSLPQDLLTFTESGSHIMIATPGRLEDLLKKSGLIDTKQLEILVLDEADRLLDMGFQAALASIISRLPKQRRTGLFSATMTDALEEYKNHNINV